MQCVVPALPSPLPSNYTLGQSGPQNQGTRSKSMGSSLVACCCPPESSSHSRPCACGRAKHTLRHAQRHCSRRARAHRSQLEAGMAPLSQQGVSLLAGGSVRTAASWAMAASAAPGGSTRGRYACRALWRTVRRSHADRPPAPSHAETCARTRARIHL